MSSRSSSVKLSVSGWYIIIICCHSDCLARGDRIIDIQVSLVALHMYHSVRSMGNRNNLGASRTAIVWAFLQSLKPSVQIMVHLLFGRPRMQVGCAVSSRNGQVSSTYQYLNEGLKRVSSSVYSSLPAAVITCARVTCDSQASSASKPYISASVAETGMQLC